MVEKFVNEENNVDEKELELAQQEAENSTDTFTIHLKKPVLYNNTEYSELSFDFSKLTGRAGLDIEQELQAIGRPALIPAFSGEYLVRMAARACTTAKIGCDIFDNMKLSDYNKVRSAARSFLLQSE